MNVDRAQKQTLTSGSMLRRSLLLLVLPKRLMSCMDLLIASCSFMLSSLFQT